MLGKDESGAWYIKWMDVLFFILVVAAFLIMFQTFKHLQITEIVSSGLVTKLFMALFAISIMRLCLWMLDKRSNVKFKEWLEKADTRDEAIYYGLRYLGTCILFAMIIG